MLRPLRPPLEDCEEVLVETAVVLDALTLAGITGLGGSEAGNEGVYGAAAGL